MSQVVPSDITRIEKKKVVFKNNMEKEFDAIVFATGYKSIANGWLKVYAMIKINGGKIDHLHYNIHIFYILYFYAFACVFSLDFISHIYSNSLS